MQRLGDKVWKNNLFVPSTDVYASSPDSPFMQYSTCSSRDFFHPEFKRLFGLLNFSPFFFHRKYPEWVFILHHISVVGVNYLGRSASIILAGWRCGEFECVVGWK